MFSISSLFFNFDLFNSFRDIDFFNSILSCFDSEIRQFNNVTSFLRNLEHCQELYRYRKTKLLEYMLWALNDSVWKWFKKQSHFNSLSRFNMILTKAFFSQKQRELKSVTQKRTKRKAQKIAKRTELNVIKTAKQTSTFQNIDIFDSTACDESEFELYNEVANFLQHLQQCQHRYRKSNLLNLLSKSLCDFAFEWFKTQFEFISLKRFNKVLTKTFSSAKIFSRRASSRNSNLQLCTLVAMSKSMKNASNQQVVQTICKLCKQNFNFNEKLYEHIRNHEALKFVKNSHLSINAINLVCEIEKRSFASQKSHDSFTKSQKSIFEFAVAFEAITLLKRSTFQSFALETASESTKKLSACRHCKQTFNFKKMFRQHKREQHAKRLVVNSHLLIDAVKSACESMKISTINSSFFASFAIQSKQMSEFSTFFESIVSFKNSFLTSFTFETIYQFNEKSAVTLFLFANLDNFNSARSHQNSEKKRFNQIVIFIQHFQQCQHLYCESKLFEWVKIVLCDFVDIWFENQSNFIFLHDFDIALTKTFSTSIFTHVSFASFAKSQNSIFEFTATFKSIISHAKKSVISSFFRFHAFKSAFKAEKKSAVKNVTILFASQKLQIRVQKSQKIDVQKSSVINSSFSTITINSTCKVTKKSTIISIAKASKIISKQKVEWRFRIAYLFTRLKASRLSFSLNTFVTISETMKNASIQKIACARAMCRFCKQNFNFNNKLFEHIREHEALKCINDFHFSINTIKATCEFVQKSTNTCSSFSYKSLIFTTSRNLISNTKTYLQFVSRKCSSLQLRVLNSASKSTKNTSIQRIVCVRTICKRCKQNFNFNNKLHEHIRQHYARKSVKSSDFRVFTSESTYKIVEKSAVSCSINSQFAFFILFATSRSQIFSAEIASRSVSSSDSHFSITTSKITSRSIKKLSTNCSFTFSTSSSQTSIWKHQKSHNEFYFIVNDLSRMFHEKSKSFDLRQHHNRRFSSQSFDIRQFHFSSFSKKSYLIIENLFEMFDEKFRKKSMFQNQKNVFSRKFFSEQSRITIYFKSTVNQKSSISQDSKNSKSKSLNQHMFAKSIRTVFNKILFEKSINLSYKSTDVFYVKNKFLQILDFYKSRFSKSRTPAEISFLILVFFRFFFDFSSCSRIRFDHFNYKNELH